MPHLKKSVFGFKCPYLVQQQMKFNTETSNVSSGIGMFIVTPFENPGTWKVNSHVVSCLQTVTTTNN